MKELNNTHILLRRRFLGLLAGTATAIATTTPVTSLAAVTKSTTATPKASNLCRQLSFYNTHTREKLNVVYWENGKLAVSGLRKLDKLLRDHRQNQFIKMDARLYDQLWTLQQNLGSTGVFHIISGYRSPKTNALLRKNTSGVAKKSYHMQGRAIDVRLSDVSLRKLRSAALKLSAGGVGYYPNSDFIHLDTGPVRHWAS